MERPGADPAVACTLGPGAGRAQLDEWAKLRRLHQRTEATNGGVRLWFDSAAEVAVREVAATEAACCGFLRLEVVRDANLVRLEITSELTDAQPVITRLASEAGGYASE
jgi:hypothetical protein